MTKYILKRDSANDLPWCSQHSCRPSECWEIHNPLSKVYAMGNQSKVLKPMQPCAWGNLDELERAVKNRKKIEDRIHALYCE